MKVSVVIPVYNDHDRLALCLRALEEQTLPAEDFEIIVVDNGSSEPLNGDLAANTTIVVESLAGSYAARNKGIRCTTAPIVAFTDADCVPEPNWLAEGLTYLDEHPDVSCIGGRIEVFPRDPDHRTPAEVYESIHGFPQEAFIAKHRFAATANLFVRSAAIEAVGPFNATLRSGGDLEFGNRLIDAGYRLEYTNSVAVRHPARRTLRSLLNKLLRTMAGIRDLASIRGHPFPFPLRGTMRTLVPPIRGVVRALGNDEVTTPTDRIKCVYAVVVVRYAKAAFQFRLLFGARSPR